MQQKLQFVENTFNPKVVLVISTLFVLFVVFATHNLFFALSIIIIFFIIPSYMTSFLEVVINDKSLEIKVIRGLIRRKIVFMDIKELVVRTNRYRLFRTPYLSLRRQSIVFSVLSGTCYGVSASNPQLEIQLLNGKKITLFAQEAYTIAREILIRTEKKLNILEEL